MTTTAAGDVPRPASRGPWGGVLQWPDAKRPPRAGAYGLALSFPVAFLAANVALWFKSLEIGLQLAAVTGGLAFGLPFLWFRWSDRHAAAAFGAARAAGAPLADADWPHSRAGAAGRFPALTPLSVHIVAFQIANGVGLLRSTQRAGGSADRWILGTLLLLVTLVIARRIWLGHVQITFAGFPYVVGAPVRVFVGMTPGSAAVRQARYLLRCVGDVPPPAGRRRTVWNVFWSGEGAPPTDRMPGPDEFVELTFTPPDGLPDTSLHAEPHARWELVVQCRTRFGQISETFLVPVYAAPGAGSAAAS